MTSTNLKTGVYRIGFSSSVTGCAISIDSAQYLGTGIIGINPGAIDPPDLSHHFFSVYSDLSVANALVVGERDASGTLTDGPFSLVMFCSTGD